MTRKAKATAAPHPAGGGSSKHQSAARAGTPSHAQTSQRRGHKKVAAEPGPLASGDASFSQLVKLFAQEVARQVAEQLMRGDAAALVDQYTSELGPRHHIWAIKSGALPGRRLGRRYVARRSDVEAYVASSLAPDQTMGPELDAADELAAEMGLISNED